MILKVYLFILRLFIVPIPTMLGTILRFILYKPLLKSTNGFYRISENVEILGFQNIIIGKNFYAASNSKLHAHEGGSIKVGDNFGINYNSQLGAASGKIVIGDDCAIGPNCVLRAANHTIDNPDILFRNQGHTYGEIILENDVWIASNCVITANTKIARSSIIAAGSVVSKDVLAYSIMGGVPAKLIKKRK